jgi:dihydroxyacetone kinase
VLRVGRNRQVELAAQAVAIVAGGGGGGHGVGHWFRSGEGSYSRVGIGKDFKQVEQPDHA